MLNQLNTSYGRQYPGLFQHYLPNIGPMMTENDLQAQMEEERRVQVCNFKAQLPFFQVNNMMLSCIGMRYNHRMWRKVCTLCSHTSNITLDFRPSLRHYLHQLILTLSFILLIVSKNDFSNNDLNPNRFRHARGSNNFTSFSSFIKTLFHNVNCYRH